MWNQVHSTPLEHRGCNILQWFCINILCYQPSFTNLLYSYSPVRSCQDIDLPFPKQNQLDWGLVLWCPYMVIWLCSALWSTNCVYSHSWMAQSFHHSLSSVKLLCCTFAWRFYTPLEHCSRGSLWLSGRYENILKLFSGIYLTIIILTWCCSCI